MANRHVDAPVAHQDNVPVQPKATPRELTPAETEQVDLLYAELKPEATEMARNYVLNRTPAPLQEAMTAKIDADWPVPPVTGMAARAQMQQEQEAHRARNTKHE